MSAFAMSAFAWLMLAGGIVIVAELASIAGVLIARHVRYGVARRARRGGAR